MCGIAGIIASDNRLVRQEILQRMGDALQHRGPDGEGYWMNDSGKVGFAHRRLAIIDTGPRGAQPLHYLHYTIIFNGEVYNYKELKRQLQQQGYRFATATDTEVVPAMIDHYGIDGLQQIDGMFAFALWNNTTGELLLARDRFGEKPLFYHATFSGRGRFEQILFASEMKGLWAAGVPKSLNGTMMLNYLTLGMVQNPLKKTDTFYSNILSLPPGHYIIISPAAAKLRMHKWYKPHTVVPAMQSSGTTDVIAQFKELFFTGVSRRLRSDVSVGTSLSGGIDSAAVVAAIQAVKTPGSAWKNTGFTAVFPGFEQDETQYSQMLAGHFSMQHKTIQPTAADWVKHFDRLMYHQEEPLQSSSVLTQYMVYALARENDITVLLDGQGADEVLGGYKKYTHWFLQQLFSSDTTAFARERKLLRENQFLEQWGWRNYAAAFFPDKAAKALQHRAISQQAKHPFINPEFLLKYRNEDSLQKPVVKQLEDILYYNTFHIGLPELLRYADRNSMAHGREVRLPFLFHELVEFVFAQPATVKIRDGYTKWLLRKSVEQLLPPAIAWRKGKVGFEPPQQQWMEQPAVQEMIMAGREKLVLEKVLQPAVLDSPVVAKAAHDAENADWRILCAAALFSH